MIRDTAAQNKSLDNDYGATKGANAPASHVLALFAGDPNLTGVELTSAGGYARVTVTNNGTNWPAASDGLKVAAAQSFPASTAAWSDVATHWALFDAADGTTCWDTGTLDEEIDVSAAGVTASVTPKVFYETWG
jgi:hypothetical protein